MFGISSGQPLTLQAAEQQVCANVYDPDCAGIVALPADLADECVTLDPSCTPGAQGDGGEDVSISDDQSSLVVKTSNPTLTRRSCSARSSKSRSRGPNEDGSDADPGLGAR